MSARKCIKAVDRVKKALARLSRDRWLSGYECMVIAYKLACCASRNPSWTCAHSMPDCCHIVGMIRGQPPATPNDKDYPQFVKELHRLNRDKAAKAELIIFKLYLRRMENER